MPVYVNEFAPDDESMDIVEAELKWNTDDDGLIWANGLLSYEIDCSNELAVFNGDKCVEIRKGTDLRHTMALAEAFERTALRNESRGENWRGKKGALL